MEVSNRRTCYGSAIGIATCPRPQDPGPNEDAVALIESATGCNGFVVCDGVGSLPDSSEIASHVANELARQLAVEFGTAARSGVAVDRIRSAFTEARKSIENPEKNGATTAIAILDQADRYTVAYLGNGGVLHIRGSFVRMLDRKLFPWTWVNLLNPDSLINDQGKEALYGTLSSDPDSLLLTEPAVVEYHKRNADRYGDLFVACTDGIMSADQSLLFTPPSGRLLTEIERPLRMLLPQLGEFMGAAGRAQEVNLPSGENSEGQVETRTDQTEPVLSDVLQDYLSKLEENELLVDDASIGVMVSERSLAL